MCRCRQTPGHRRVVKIVGRDTQQFHERGQTVQLVSRHRKPDKRLRLIPGNETSPTPAGINPGKPTKGDGARMRRGARGHHDGHYRLDLGLAPLVDLLPFGRRFLVSGCVDTLRGQIQEHEPQTKAGRH